MTTRVEDIVLSVGRTGRVTPTACFSPVLLAGSTVARATLNNEDYVKDKDIRIGDIVTLHKAGDVIPEVGEVVRSRRPEGTVPFRFATVCPFCHQALVKDGVNIFCVNSHCPSRNINNIINFSSDKGMDIDGLGEVLIETLFNEKLLSTIPDIYTLKDKKAILTEMDGLGEKSVSKLLEAIEKSKTNDLSMLLSGLGIPLVGKKTAQLLSQSFLSMEALANADPARIAALPDIGELTAQKIHAWFADPGNRQMVAQLKELGLNMESLVRPTVAVENFFSGKRFVITGTLSQSRPVLTARLEKLGAKSSSAVSSKTDILIAGEEAGSKLTKAKALHIRIIGEGELMNLLAEAERLQKGEN